MPNAPNLLERKALFEAITSSEGRKQVVDLQNNEARTVLMLLQEVGFAPLVYHPL